jgi:WD40 repeat protein
MRLLLSQFRRRINALRFSPSSTGLFCAVRNFGHWERIDFTSTDRISTSTRGLGDVTSFACSPDQRLIVLGRQTGVAEVLNLPLATPQATLNVLPNRSRFSGRVDAVFAPTTIASRIRLAVAGAQFLIWQPYSQEYIVAEDEGAYRGASFGPDGAFVASIEYHANRLTVWNIKPFRVIFRSELTVSSAFDNGSIVVLPDGDRIVYAVANQLQSLSISGGPSWTTQLTRPLLDLALDPTGRSILGADGSKKVTQFDTSNGQTTHQFDWNIGKVSCLDIATDGTLAAAGGEKGQIAVWDLDY